MDWRPGRWLVISLLLRLRRGGLYQGEDDVHGLLAHEPLAAGPAHAVHERVILQGLQPFQQASSFLVLNLPAQAIRTPWSH